MDILSLIAPIAAIIGLIVAFSLATWISKADEGNDRMREIAGHIREGAMAFLKREYKVMAIVIIVIFLVIGIFIGWVTALLYVIGALLSVLAGFFGMNVANLPFETDPYGFWIILLITTVICLILTILLSKNKLL